MMHRYFIELNTSSEIEEFVNACFKVQSEVMVGGKDENGSNWYLSAKSFLCSLIMSKHLKNKQKKMAQKADWNTIYVESEDEIYSLISKFIKEYNNGEIN